MKNNMDLPCVNNSNIADLQILEQLSHDGARVVHTLDVPGQLPLHATLLHPTPDILFGHPVVVRELYPLDQCVELLLLIVVGLGNSPGLEIQIQLFFGYVTPIPVVMIRCQVGGKLSQSVLLKIEDIIQPPPPTT